MMGTVTIPSPAGAQGIFFFSSLMGLAGSFPNLSRFLTCMHQSEVTCLLGSSAHLCTSFSSPTCKLCLSPWNPGYIFSTLGHSQAQFYTPSPWPRNALRIGSQSNHWAHLVSFQSFRITILHYLIHNVLKTVISFVLSGGFFVVVSGRRVNLFPVTPIWPASEVIFYFKHGQHTSFITFLDNPNIYSLFCCLFVSVRY